MDILKIITDEEQLKAIATTWVPIVVSGASLLSLVIKTAFAPKEGSAFAKVVKWIDFVALNLNKPKK